MAKIDDKNPAPPSDQYSMDWEPPSGQYLMGWKPKDRNSMDSKPDDRSLKSLLGGLPTNDLPPDESTDSVFTLLDKIATDGGEKDIINVSYWKACIEAIAEAQNMTLPYLLSFAKPISVQTYKMLDDVEVVKALYHKLYEQFPYLKQETKVVLPSQGMKQQLLNKFNYLPQIQQIEVTKIKRRPDLPDMPL